MNNNMGTPKNLNQAIRNGMLEANFKRIGRKIRPEDIEGVVREEATLIETHVIDFLRQKFSVAYLDMGTLQKFVATEHGYSNSKPMTILQHLARTLGVETVAHDAQSADLTKRTGT